MRALNLTDRQFGRLVALFREGHAGGKVAWQCRCACGKYARVAATHLVRGHTTSCGCISREHMARVGKSVGPHKYKHGGVGTSEYSSWRNMVGRCSYKSHKSYRHYGARGIKVCLRWLGPDGFKHFLGDMGRKPGPEYSVERKNNNDGYNKDNCRWATRKEQARNTQRNVLITYRGETLCLKDWAIRLGINQGTLRARLRQLPVEEVLQCV